MLLEGKPSAVLRLVGSPRFIYGTAWKKDRSTALVTEALEAGFRAVDTACQPKHYQESLVGQGLRNAFKANICRREDVFLQTKFTPPNGQDPKNIPYDPTASLEEQIRRSIQVSLNNLRPEDDEESAQSAYIDCLLLHSPLRPFKDTLLAWKILESYVPDRIRTLGISNVVYEDLSVLFNEATEKPKVVQNRFYNRTGFDVQLRQFCRERDIVYESFWTLSANPGLLSSAAVSQLTQLVGIEKEQALYALVMAQEIAVLNGTTNTSRMTGDLAGISAVADWAKSDQAKWQSLKSEFEKLLK